MLRFAMVLLLLFGASDSQLEQLAQNGKIQDNAPVKASSEITINAKPERVWALLSGCEQLANMAERHNQSGDARTASAWDRVHVDEWNSDPIAPGSGATSAGARLDWTSVQGEGDPCLEA